MRTRRAHPSEKPPFAPSRGFPRKAILARMVPPRRGGLRTPATTPLAPLEHFAGRPLALRLPLGRHAIAGACVRPNHSGAQSAPLRRNQPSPRPVIMTCPGLRPAHIPGRGGRPPPRKPHFASSPGLPPQGHPSLDGTPAEGRALHARDEGTTLIQMLSPFGHWLIVKAPVATPWLATRPAVRCGRAERVPPRKSAFAYPRAFPR
jgi:hypothetical protein